MKALGQTLMIIGVLVGVVTGVGIVVGWNPFHLPWLLSVGFIKLVLLAAVGFLGAGATLTRLAKRAAARQRGTAGSAVD